jgi:hypothetical protein
MKMDEFNSLVVNSTNLLKENNHPNINHLWYLLKDMNIIKLNIKNLGYNLARELHKNLSQKKILGEPQYFELESKACTQDDIESPWFSYWINEIKATPIYHRKLWEFAFCLQTLYNFDLLRSGRRGFGFGCGQEPLPSYFASKEIETIVSDLEPEKVIGMGWAETGQHTTAKDQAFYPDIVAKDRFDIYCNHKFIDMNNIPEIEPNYDFCWSICSLEHLGSIKNGLDFIENSLKVLKPGGIAIHTTEFNYLSNSETIDNWPTVLFTRDHFLTLKERVEKNGHELIGPNFNVGNGVLDRFVDLPPYSLGEGWLSREQWSNSESNGHLKLAIDGFPSTCFGVVIKKAK